MSEEVTSRFFLDFRSKSDEIRASAAAGLRSYVERESRELSSELFTVYMGNLNKKVFDLVNSSDVNEKLGGILVIDELIDVPYEENETKLIRFAQYLRMIFQQSNDNTDQRLLREGSRALGHLARSGGTLAADTVEFEVKRALEWLQGDRSEQRRYAAVLVLKELAQNTPTLFNVHVEKFLSHIWVTLRDPKALIREASIEALHNCLLLIAKRGRELRTDRYRTIYTELQHSLKSSNGDYIHGALLTLGELLLNTGDFMNSKYKEVIESVIRFRDHKEKLVRETVISLLPKLANFQPEQFIRGYFDTCAAQILGILKKGESKEIAFLALGELAAAVKDAILPVLPDIIEKCRTHLQQDKKKFTSEALNCVGNLAVAINVKLLPYMNELLELMFASGLSANLVEALRLVSTHIPSLLPNIQDRLLNTLNNILATQSTANNPNKDIRRSSVLFTAKFSMPATDNKLDNLGNSSSSIELIYLALNTLASFDFRNHNLLPFVRECVLSYLDHDSAAIRNIAARTAAALILRPNALAEESYQLVLMGNNFEEKNKLDADDSRIQLQLDSMGGSAAADSSLSSTSHAMICEVIERLLTVAIADPEPNIRRAVLQSLDNRFDQFLASSENVHSLFVALNDEVFSIRSCAMTVIGRLAVRNPAYVMPSLRKALIQLLTEVQYGGDNRNREESAELLGHLIASSQSLIKPYVGPMLKVLVPKLTGNKSDASVASSVLATLGRLAQIGGEDMNQYIDTLLPLIINIIQDKSSLIRRDIALDTLAQLVQSTGFVIEPYNLYKSLLPSILNHLKSNSNWQLRRACIKSLGVLGALDPFKHKMNQISSINTSNADTKSSGEAKQAGQANNNHNITSNNKQQLAAIAEAVAVNKTIELLPSMLGSTDDYYPTVAIHALMRMLKEPSLAQHHKKVILAVMFIVDRLGNQCIPFLPLIVPPFLSVLKNLSISSEDNSLRESLFNQLGTLVQIVKSNIKNYLNEIFELIYLYWNTQSYLIEQILLLVERICMAMREEFKVYLPGLLPLMLSTLHSDKSTNRIHTIKVLHAFQIFGTNLADYLHLIIPCIVRLAESHEAIYTARIPCIHTLGVLCRLLNLTDYASRIIHPIARILESTNNPIQYNNKTNILQSLREEIMQTLCLLVYQLGSGYAIFVPMMAKIMTKLNLHHW
jgi:FKBP12-rapamycin complex-associated protein